MHIIFSYHARLKMAQRRIPSSVVIGSVRFPDFREQGRNGREELYKRFRGTYLKVVVKEVGTKVIVVTAHLVAKPKGQ